MGSGVAVKIHLRSIRKQFWVSIGGLSKEQFDPGTERIVEGRIHNTAVRIKIKGVATMIIKLVDQSNENGSKELHIQAWQIIIS
jgi:hypothetical protein